MLPETALMDTLIVLAILVVTPLTLALCDGALYATKCALRDRRNRCSRRLR